MICGDSIRRTKSLSLLLKIMWKFCPQQERSSLKYHPASKRTSSRSNTRHPPRNGRPRSRQPEHPPGSNTNFFLDYICTTFLQEGRASWLEFVRSVLSLISSPRIQEQIGLGNMTSIAVEAVPAGSRSPAVDDSMRTSKGGRYGFVVGKVNCYNYIECLNMLTSPEVQLSGQSSSNLSGRHRPGGRYILPLFTRSAAEAPSVRLRVFVSGSTYASLVRHSCRASCSRPAKR